MQVYSRTHKGLVRPTNQDAILMINNLFGVADGMGGHLGGETASKLAVQVVEAMLSGKKPSANVLRTGVEAANRRIFETQRSDASLKGMGTTLTLLWETADQVLIAHVGDSRAYLMRDGKLNCVTTDHSVVGEMLRNQTITAQQAKYHPYRNVITRAVGTSPVVEVDLLKFEKLPGDVWLICSDGLFNKIEDDDMETVLLRNHAQAAVDLLLEIALERGAEDNVSILLGYVPEVNAK